MIYICSQKGRKRALPVFTDPPIASVIHAFGRMVFGYTLLVAMKQGVLRSKDQVKSRIKLVRSDSRHTECSIPTEVR